MTPELDLSSAHKTALVRWLNELATAGIFTTDTTLNVTSWNRWFVRATGRSEEQVLGRALFDLFPELRARGFDAHYHAALRGEGIILAHRFHRYLLEIQTAAGPLPQTTRIAPLLCGDTIVGTVTVIEDVSERVTSEAELRRQIAELDKARRIAEDALRVKDEFLATLSHELRTPLNAVMGWTRILQEGGVDPQTTKQALTVIDRNVDAQARLIDDLLDISRIAAGKLRLELGPVNLLQCVTDAIDAVMPAANGKQLTIERRLCDAAIILNADGGRLQQVIWNLLANAVKFTPRGGTIIVAVERHDRAARVSVVDTGKGISPDFLPHVFDRFAQASSSTTRVEGGLGLGLALARQLIEMHGGEIDAHSEGVGQGATFTLTLPLTPPVAEAPIRGRAEMPPLTGLRILLVDDAEDWARLIAHALSERGAEVTVAGTAEDALAAAGQNLPDVLVADIGLPGEDGYAMLRRLRADHRERHVPAIAVTAYAGEQHRARAVDAGFDAYRAKPLSAQELIAAIAELVHGTP
jgi:PAS domain S-box-containing protein